jgi:hypothetical protein
MDLNPKVSRSDLELGRRNSCPNPFS